MASEMGPSKVFSSARLLCFVGDMARTDMTPKVVFQLENESFEAKLIAIETVDPIPDCND
jgi:hypothetical protein